MKGYYNKQSEICSEEDRHFFHKMLNGMKRNLMVRKVSIGDVVIIKNGLIARWKIVKDEDSQIYMGYIRDYVYPSKETSVYVITNSSDPKNPYLALRRVKNKSNVLDIVKLFENNK